jgi:hypothetical protein
MAGGTVVTGRWELRGSWRIRPVTATRTSYVSGKIWLRDRLIAEIDEELCIPGSVFARVAIERGTLERVEIPRGPSTGWWSRELPRPRDDGRTSRLPRSHRTLRATAGPPSTVVPVLVQLPSDRRRTNDSASRDRHPRPAGSPPDVFVPDRVGNREPAGACSRRGRLSDRGDAQPLYPELMFVYGYVPAPRRGPRPQPRTGWSAQGSRRRRVGASGHRDSSSSTSLYLHAHTLTASPK